MFHAPFFKYRSESERTRLHKGDVPGLCEGAVIDRNISGKERAERLRSEKVLPPNNFRSLRRQIVLPPR